MVMIPKPAKGTRKLEQWARTDKNARARLKAKAPTRLHRTRLRPIGERGLDQNEWQRKMKRDWVARYGALICCISGVRQQEVSRGMDSVVVCGHVLAVSDRPDLAQDVDNVAPISSEWNNRMRPGSTTYSPEDHALAVAKMKEWIAKDIELRLTLSLGEDEE